MGTSKKSKVTNKASIEKFLSGLNLHYAGQTLMLNGVPITVEALAAMAAAYFSALDDADAARTAWNSKLAAAKALAPPLQKAIVAGHNYVRAQFGVSSHTLEDFGLTPRSTAPKTLAVQSGAVVKALATRQARHTMGTKQKAAIHGVVPAAAAAGSTPTPTGSSVPAASGSAKG
jgi:hypothetical protein